MTAAGAHNRICGENQRMEKRGEGDDVARNQVSERSAVGMLTYWVPYSNKAHPFQLLHLHFPTPPFLFLFLFLFLVKIEPFSYIICNLYIRKLKLYIITRDCKKFNIEMSRESMHQFFIWCQF